jgi:hypothetical protein
VEWGMGGDHVGIFGLLFGNVRSLRPFSTSDFPFCKQASLEDAFYRYHVKGILDQTEGFGHPLHDACRGGMRDIILKWKKEREDAALVDHFMNHSKEGKNITLPELAHEMLRFYEWHKHLIYNYIPSESMKLEQMAPNVMEEHYKKC